MRTIRRLPALLLLALAFPATSAGQAKRPRPATQIRMVPGAAYPSPARGLNNLGHVATTLSSPNRPSVWDGKRTRHLPRGGLKAVGLAINDSGTVAGYAYPWPPCFPCVAAAVWINGKLHLLGDPIGDPGSEAADINNAGTVVGRTYLHLHNSTPVVWSNGLMTELPRPPGISDGEANAINAAGVIAGTVMTLDGGEPVRACRWINGQPELLPLGPSGEVSSASGINDLGQIVGTIYPSGAALWSPDGELTLLPTPPPFIWSGARDINNRGQVVGVMSLSVSDGSGTRSTSTATLWQNGTPPGPQYPPPASLPGRPRRRLPHQRSRRDPLPRQPRPPAVARALPPLPPPGPRRIIEQKIDNS